MCDAVGLSAHLPHRSESVKGGIMHLQNNGYEEEVYMASKGN